MASRLSIVVLAALIAAPVSISGSTISASAQQFGRTNGRNVTTAYHRDGRFEQVGARNWAEYDLNGRVTYRFEEVQRDDWSVYLLDRSRNVRVQIDLHRAWIRYAQGRSDYSDLYRVTRADDRSGSRPGPDDWRGRGATYRVEVGPIWNQRDAETTCNRVAEEVGGRWTGQWVTTRQGAMSVCEIRWRTR